MNKPDAKREAQLIEDIRRQLALVWGVTLPTLSIVFVRTRCEAMRNDFWTLTEAEADHIVDPIEPWEVTKKRDRLLAIKEAGHAMAVAVARAPQDYEWLPQGKFKEYELPGSTEISTLAELVSECAAIAAEKLELPKARSTPKEDLCAFLVWGLCVEDVRMCGSTTVRSVDEYIKERSAFLSDEYNKDRWAYLSPAFRRGHNQLRKLRGLAPLPRPQQQRKLSLPQTPTKTRRATGPYYTMTPLFYEFFTGEEPPTGLSWSCKKVVKQYGFRP